MSYLPFNKENHKLLIAQGFTHFWMKGLQRISTTNSTAQNLVFLIKPLQEDSLSALPGKWIEKISSEEIMTLLEENTLNTVWIDTTETTVNQNLQP